MTRGEKVERIVKLIEEQYLQAGVGSLSTLDFQTESKRPYTFVRVNGNHVNGRGFSKCSAPDKWDAIEGLRIAAKRAARDYVDNIDKWENLIDGE